jgi:uncharacterized protein (TIGR02117 family)
MKRSALCLILVLIVLEGCIDMPQRRTEESALRAQSQTIIYVARRGWHIDIGFDVADLAAPLAAVAADFPTARYVFFGFGDRRYLLAKHKNFPSLLAALWPGAAMVLATGLVAPPDEAFGDANVVRLRVSTLQAQEARDFVWNSLVKANGAVRFYAKGPYEESLYYSAVPTYSAVYTCNTWVAEALRTSGLPIHSVGVVFAAQLWTQVRRINAAAMTESGGGPVSHAALSYRSKSLWPFVVARVGSTPRT